jgi:hypothetical protein
MPSEVQMKTDEPSAEWKIKNRLAEGREEAERQEEDWEANEERYLETEQKQRIANREAEQTQQHYKRRRHWVNV